MRQGGNNQMRNQNNSSQPQVIQLSAGSNNVIGNYSNQTVNNPVSQVNKMRKIGQNMMGGGQIAGLNLGSNYRSGLSKDNSSKSRSIGF